MYDDIMSRYLIIKGVGAMTKKLCGVIVLYFVIFLLVALFYFLPEWTGNAWLWDRLLSAASFSFLCVASIIYLAKT